MSLLRRPGIILWLLAAVALGVAGHNDPLPTRLLAGVLMALPALMRLAFLVGRREAVPVGGAAEVLDTPPEREPLDVGDPRDPLRRPWVARTVAGLILAAAAVALALSLVAGAPRPLPDVALSSPALLHLQRTAVAMAPRFQPILIDPDEVRAQLDQIEVERKPVVEDPVRREQLRRVQRHAEDAVRYAELALRLVGREPRNR